jgi:hypothetical protein
MNDLEGFLTGPAKQSTGGSSKLEDFLGAPGASAPSEGRRLAGTVASAADLLSGFVGQIIETPVIAGAEITGAALSPWTHESSKHILQSGAEIGAKVDPISGIAERTVQKLGGGKPEDYSQNVVHTAMGKVSKAIQSVGDYLEGKTQGMVPSEAFTQFTNALMLKAPGLTHDAAKFVAKRLITRRAAESAGKILEEGGKPIDPFEMAKEPPTDAEIQQVKKDLDAHRNAEQKAYDLMQEGASTKAVEKAIAKNPLVGEKLEALRAARQSAGAAFDKDFMAKYGEVVSPEPKLPVEVNLKANYEPGWENFHANLYGAKTVGEGLGKIAADSKMPEQFRALAEALQKTSAAKAGLRFDLPEGKTFTGQGGTYYPKTHEVALFNGSGPQAFLHEATHAAVVRNFRDLHVNHPARAALQDLYDHTLRTATQAGLGVREHYGLNNVDDFIAEAFSNPKFQKYLSGLEMKGPTGAIHTAWQSFLGAVKKLLGAEHVPDNVLEQVIKHGSNVAEMKGRVPLGEAGKADPRLLVGMALGLGGAALGANLAGQDKLEGALLGGLTGLALTQLPRYVDAMKANWRATALSTAGIGTVIGGGTLLDKKHPVEGALLGAIYGSTKLLPKAVIPKVGDLTIDELINLANGQHAIDMRRTGNLSWAIRQVVPDAARREELSRKIESGNLSGLTPDEMKVAHNFRSFMDSYGEAAKDVGLIKDVLQNYVTHIVEKEALPTSKVQEVMQSLFGEEAMQPGAGGSRFAKHRKYATFAELQNALEGSGLKVKTMDLADIVDIYGRAMSRAIQNKRLISNLKAAQLGDRPMIVEGEKAPPGFQPINSPQMRGMLVHPDIAPSLRFVLEGRNPGEVTRGILTLSLAQKRLAVGLSMFHASNLLNAYAGAMGTDVFRAKAAVDAALKLYREGGAGDAVDMGLRNGLNMGRPIETDLNALRKLGALGDTFVERMTGVKTPAGETALGGVEKLQKEIFDKVTWDYLQPGLKLATFLKKYEDGLRAHPEMSPDEVARQAASFSNDTFGGLDWYRVATEAETQFGRKAMLGAFSPASRVGLQVLMFAPDWTMSTFRAMYKALPGATKLQYTAALHRGYVLRTAVIYATLMNGYNLMASGNGDPHKGHYIWQNKDPTKIEWADGSTQQVAKHAMEGVEWLINPTQTALNKLGYVPKELLNQVQGTEYLTGVGRPKVRMAGTPIEHALKGTLPISGAQFNVPGRGLGKSVEEAVLSAAGLPLTPTRAEKEAAKREARRKRQRDLERR